MASGCKVCGWNLNCQHIQGELCVPEWYNSNADSWRNLTPFLRSCHYADRIPMLRNLHRRASAILIQKYVRRWYVGKTI